MRSRASRLRPHSIVIDWRLTTLPLDAIEFGTVGRRRADDDTRLVGAATRAGDAPTPNEEPR